MAERTRNIKRYRLSVPEADTSVNDWIASQDNLSFSLRCIIKDAIARYGLTDVTCIGGFHQEPQAVVLQDANEQLMEPSVPFDDVTAVTRSGKGQTRIAPVIEPQIKEQQEPVPEPVSQPELPSQTIEKKKPMLSQEKPLQQNTSDALKSLLE